MDAFSLFLLLIMGIFPQKHEKEIIMQKFVTSNEFLTSHIETLEAQGLPKAKQMALAQAKEAVRAVLQLLALEREIENSPEPLSEVENELEAMASLLWMREKEVKVEEPWFEPSDFLGGVCHCGNAMAEDESHCGCED